MVPSEPPAEDEEVVDAVTSATPSVINSIKKYLPAPSTIAGIVTGIAMAISYAVLESFAALEAMLLMTGGMILCVHLDERRAKREHYEITMADRLCSALRAVLLAGIGFVLCLFVVLIVIVLTFD